ncbi:MAG: hypothetical protein QXT45_05080 [Candidatus Bilamarchaeaceae archaeon]
MEFNNLGIKKASADRAISITRAFEGASFSAVSGNFDGGIFSVGILQWNVKSGTLLQLLAESYKKNPQRFMNIFGTRFSEVLIAAEKMNKGFFEAIAADPAERRRFTSMLSLWGTAFSELQMECAYRLVRAAHEICLSYELKSEVALCWAYDIVVQNGSMGKAKTEAKRAVDKLRKEKAGERKILEEMTQIRGKYVLSRWREDYLSRKLTIVRLRGEVHGKKYDLAKEFGLSYTPYMEERRPS